MASLACQGKQAARVASLGTTPASRGFLCETSKLENVMHRIAPTIGALTLFAISGQLYETKSVFAADSATGGAQERPSEPVPGINPDETLSEQLDRDKGVINPPPVGDAEIHTTVPNPDPGTTRVIPPPGTPGGDQSVQPK
jgi:hypothetical protein